ncbi:2OG-Fe(II) oxygenase [Streptomyces sp. NPDC056347]|uniref:2OG-Fe(II) oxygenase n=1 Tax=Streptomyces sp. NPDC056347 TaxID=3345790 RepID=UPI0035E06DAA
MGRPGRGRQLGRGGRRARRVRRCVAAAADHPGRGRPDPGPVRAVRAVPVHRRHGPPPVRIRRVQVRSARGWSAAPVRHGVSALRSGHRHTLALVFHDAA